ALKQVALTGYADAPLHEHILHSVKLVLMGFIVAVAAGVPLGLAMGWSARAEALINPTFLLIRPIPPLAWIPLAIVWLGLGAAAGLGRVLAQGALDLFPAMIVVGMVFVAVSGGAMTWALGRLEVLAMPWRR